MFGFSSGFLGIAICLFVYLSILSSLKSFGVPFTTPFAPSSNSKGNGYLLPPIWKREYRAPYMGTKKEKEQDKIAMKWKYNTKLNQKK